MLQDKKGNVYDIRNRAERRMHLKFNHHNIFTKKYPSKRSKIRSIIWLRELATNNK